MTEQDLRFIPHSDMSIENQTIVSEHRNLIQNNQFDDATALLNNNNYNKGFRASFFNTMQDKVRMIQEYLLAKEDVDEDTPEEIVSATEPSGDCVFWLADY